MDKTLIEAKKEQLSQLEESFELLKWKKSRTPKEEELYCAMVVGLPPLREEIAALEGKVGDRPLTVQNFAGPSARFAVDDRGNRFPVLARGEKMATLYPRPASEGEEWVGDFVRGSMGIKTIRAVDVVERGTAITPQFVSNDIIDLIREKARVIQAGAVTIPIKGPTNLCKILTDPTVLQHTEGTDDITESFPTFGPVALDPKTLVARIPLSIEVVMDSPNLDAALRMSIAGAFAGKLDALTVAVILADTGIPDSAAGEDCATWAGILAGVGSALALDQDLPKALIAGPGDYIARVGELGTANGNWLGAPPALQGMADLFTGGMTDGTAVFGDFGRGVGIAVRSELTLEMIRWGKPGFGSHVLMAYARMAGYVLQPAALYIQKTTVA